MRLNAVRLKCGGVIARGRSAPLSFNGGDRVGPLGPLLVMRNVAKSRKVSYTRTLSYLGPTLTCEFVNHSLGRLRVFFIVVLQLA